MKRIASLALVLSVAAPALASASSFDDRQAIQGERIERGRNNGSITWTEGIKLRAEQNRIARAKSRLEADGRLSKSDRATLADMQDQASQNIRAERNDGWHRLFGLPRVGK
jgi:hypothetical protein